MTCKDCKHFQKTLLMQYDIKDTEFLNPLPLYDCPYAEDWCEEDDEIMYCVIISLSQNKIDKFKKF